MRKVFSVLALLVLVASIPALAEQGDSIIRFGAAYVSPTGDFTYTEEEGDISFWEKIEADAALGGFVGFEYMVSDLVGIDGTVIYSKHDVEESFEDYYLDELIDSAYGEVVGDITTYSLFVGPNFHVKATDAIDLYVGPFLSYTMYGDFKVDGDDEVDPFEICVKNDLGYGVVVGLDAPMGSGGWSFSTALRYVETGAETDEEELELIDENFTVDVNPIILQVGVSKKW